jgi:hypothetical protein
MIRFTCSGCGKKVNAPDKAAGAPAARCPRDPEHGAGDDAK